MTRTAEDVAREIRHGFATGQLTTADAADLITAYAQQNAPDAAPVGRSDQRRIIVTGPVSSGKTVVVFAIQTMLRERFGAVSMIEGDMTGCVEDAPKDWEKDMVKQKGWHITEVVARPTALEAQPKVPASAVECAKKVGQVWCDYIASQKDFDDAVAEVSAHITAHTAQAVAAAREEPSKAVADVLAERRRQIEKEGYSHDHDDKYTHHQLAAASACYAFIASKTDDVRAIEEASRGDEYADPQRRLIGLRFWPWDWKFWKPKDRRSDLVRSVALGIAAIEQIDRALKGKAAEGGV